MPTDRDRNDDQPRLWRLDQLLSDFERDVIAAHEAYTSGKPRGPITALPTLDRELGGALQPGMHIVHAQPGIGKSAFALQVAATAGCPALFITVEMSALELLRRHTARVTGTFLGRLKSGELHPDEALRLAKVAIAAAPQLALADATRAYASPDYIRRAAAAVRGESQHFVLVIDSVHSWSESANVDASEYDRLGGALQVLRQLAGELSCPIIGIAERNRASMTTGGMSASAGHRSFEYGAESVIELAKAENAVPDAMNELPITLRLTKNRNGSPGKKIDLRFNGALQRFRESLP